MAYTRERADIQEQVKGVAMGSGRHSPTWRTPARGQTYRSGYRVYSWVHVDTVQRSGHQGEGRHTVAGTRCIYGWRRTQSNMEDTKEMEDIQEQVQGVAMGSGRHSTTWRTPAKGQTYRSRYRVWP